ncbi:MAG: hypothetical protein AAGK37_05420 [Pseudomonadota bacterium]
MADRSLGRTLWNLFLALFNATLILLALCLFLGWKVAEATNGIAAEVANRLAEFSPVRDELRSLADDIEGLRDTLATAQDSADARRTAAYAEMRGEVEALASRVDAVVEKAETLVEAPEDLIDHAVAAVGSEARETVATLGVCTAQDAAPPA